MVRMRTKTWRRALAAAGLAAAALMVAGPLQARETGFLDRTVTLNGTAHAYQVFVPKGSRKRDHLPVILFLHGTGEAGKDGLLQTDVGLPHVIRQQRARYPAIVVIPQTPEPTSWQGENETLALAALDSAISEFGGDPARVYLTGLSMGGNGTWTIGYDHPERFAALLVVSGFITALDKDYRPIVPSSEPDPFAAVARRLVAMPVWIVHGGADPVVPVREAQQMAAALQAAGAGDSHYTELPGVGHNAWDTAYADPQIIAWLFAKHR